MSVSNGLFVSFEPLPLLSTAHKVGGVFMDSSIDQLKALFDSGHALTYEDIQSRLQRTERQARRLIHQLRENGVPVRERREGRVKVFYLEPEHQQHEIEGLAFDHDEMRALAIAARASQAALDGTPHSEPLQKAFGKLLEHVAPRALLFDVDVQATLWHFDAAAPGEVLHEAFHLLEAAIEEQRSVVMDYYTASRDELTTDRRVDPLLLARRGRAWLLVAYCHLREEVRDFALEGIRKLSLCDGPRPFFTPPEAFDRAHYFRDRFSAVAGSEHYVVRLLVEADRVPYFRRRQYLSTQQIEEVRDDGRAVVSFEVEGLDEMRAWVQSWGLGVTALEPTELVEQVREEVSGLARRYSKASDMSRPGREKRERTMSDDA